MMREQLQQIRDALVFKAIPLSGDAFAEAIAILDAELAKVEQEPVAAPQQLGYILRDDLKLLANYAQAGVTVFRDASRINPERDSVAIYTAPPSLQSAQPVDYLCDGARFKLSFDEKGKTHMLSGFKAELQGQWVALVDATDNRHMKAVAPVAAPQREWQSLTDEEIIEVVLRLHDVVEDPTWYQLALSIAEALRTKNEGKNT